MLMARYVTGIVLVSAFGFALAACGGGGHSSPPPPPPGSQALTFTSFTVSPSNVSAGSTATLSYGLANPGATSTSNLALQAYISTKPFLSTPIGPPATALGMFQTISAIPPGRSTSGSFDLTIQPPSGVTPPSAFFITIVATPTTNFAQESLAPSFQLQ
jgi:hypothetical protein